MKLSRPEEFRSVMRSRKKKGSRTVVVHLLKHDLFEVQPGESVASTRSARFGLVVGKNVGNAVTRHRVSRLIRHTARQVAPQLDPGFDVVIRALPAAGEASGKELDADVRKCLSRLTGTRL